jgi:enoyl-[acyl-carrier protein] reductase II
MSAGKDLSKEYSMMNAGKAWRQGDFDLFPAGGGQVSAMIKETNLLRTLYRRWFLDDRSARSE